MIGIFRRKILSAIMIAIFLPCVAMKSRLERSGHISFHSTENPCSEGSWSKNCITGRLHKPFRIFDSFHYLFRGNKKNKEVPFKPSPVSSQQNGVRTTQSVNKPVPPTTTTTTMDLEQSIMRKNLDRLKNDPCGVSYTNINDDGSWTVPGEYPWLTLLQYKSIDPSNLEIETKCGGSLINDRYVLTTAYCLTLPEYELLSVRLGEYNVEYYEQDCTDLHSYLEDVISIEACYSIPPIDYGVSQVILYPSFSYDGKSISGLHDIGLIRLDKQVTFTSQISPICLPVGDLKYIWDARDPDTNFTSVGWGSIVVPTKSVAPLIDSSECKALLNEDLTEGQFCMRNGDGETACQGDIGGSVFTGIILEPSNNDIGTMKKTKNVQVGVMSSINCDLSTPMVFLSVEMYLPWILRTMQP